MENQTFILSILSLLDSAFQVTDELQTVKFSSYCKLISLKIEKKIYNGICWGLEKCIQMVCYN